MKNKLQIQNILQEYLPRLKQEFQIEQLGLFGSYVRDEQTTSSDLDLLVFYKSKPSLFRFLELENQLSDILEVQVDLVMESALKPNIEKRIRQELVMI